jgi:hypothetical protein
MLIDDAIESFVVSQTRSHGDRHDMLVARLVGIAPNLCF